MPYDTCNQGPADSNRVNIHKEYEVRYWTGQFGCTPGQLERAVKAVGVMVDEVEVYLKGV